MSTDWKAESGKRKAEITAPPPVATATVLVDWCPDVDWMDAVINTPELHERTRQDGTPPCGAASLRPLLDRPEISFIQARRGAQRVGFWLLVDMAEGVTEFHTTLLPHCRGAEAMEVCAAAQDFVFTHTATMRLTTGCPACIPEARLMARRCGFQVDRTALRPWVKDGVEHPVTLMSLHVMEWARQAWPRFAALGQTIHDRLELLLGAPNHPDDPNHNGMVGIAATMAVRGFPQHAEGFFNEWACRSGYAPVRFMGACAGWQTFTIANAVVSIDPHFNLKLKESPCPGPL